jgi:hypothetical protein
MFQTQVKHKAQHGGYHKRPSKKEVKALLDFYGDIDKVAKTLPNNGQMKLDLR